MCVRVSDTTRANKFDLAKVQVRTRPQRMMRANFIVRLRPQGVRFYCLLTTRNTDSNTHTQDIFKTKTRAEQNHNGKFGPFCPAGIVEGLAEQSAVGCTVGFEIRNPSWGMFVCAKRSTERQTTMRHYSANISPEIFRVKVDAIRY